MIRRLPAKLDRYPAKMVSTLAARLVEKYAAGGTSVLDPFAGSGTVLLAASQMGLGVTGIDINPISALFSQVKVDGFRKDIALSIWARIEATAALGRYSYPINWNSKDYWFTSATLSKFEALRGAIRYLEIADSNEKTAVLLALCLAVRGCSRSDQRSPKPFISKRSIQARRGRHFDPSVEILQILNGLARYYDNSGRPSVKYQFLSTDLTVQGALKGKLPRFSHVITSPPYINAQDYFRNFKLELYVLEGVLPFKIADLKERFIGTERGNLLGQVSEEEIDYINKRVPQLKTIEKYSVRNANVVRRYFIDMRSALRNVLFCLQKGGVMVVVCGDNLISGERIKTWEIVSSLVEGLGLTLFDSFKDPIRDRLLAPKRCGHKGLIKEEIVLAFQN